jgi:predicted butyrate kinase (DUF1464 family)
MGTADKVCAAAYAIADQAARLEIAPHESAMVLIELGGAFTAALAIDSGQIVDGMGGSSGPLGARAAGALDGEVAYLLAAVLRKDTLYSGGALNPAGTLGMGDLDALWTSADLAEGWTALLEAASLAEIAPVRPLVPPRASSAAHGAALLADGLAGGRHAPLVEAVRLREAGGTVLDQLRIVDADTIALG